MRRSGILGSPFAKELVALLRIRWDDGLAEIPKVDFAFHSGWAAPLSDREHRYNDTGGRLVFHLFGALAQFERDLIRERTRAELKAAEVRGRRGSRQPVVSPDKLNKARQLIGAGLNVRKAEARLKIGKLPSTTGMLRIPRRQFEFSPRTKNREH